MMTRAEVESADRGGGSAGSARRLFHRRGAVPPSEIRPLVDFTLERMPLTILTNALLIDDDLAGWIADRFTRSRYSFDLRVSLDGRVAASNDRVRGAACTTGVVEALRRLARVVSRRSSRLWSTEEALRRRGTRGVHGIPGAALDPTAAGQFLPLLRIGRRTALSRISGARAAGQRAPGPRDRGVPHLLLQPDRHGRRRHDLPILVEVPRRGLGNAPSGGARDQPELAAPATPAWWMGCAALRDPPTPAPARRLCRRPATATSPASARASCPLRLRSDPGP